MSKVEIDPLIAAIQRLQRSVDAPHHGREASWAADVHGALGQAATAIQQEVQAAENSMKTVGEINPDFQNAPGKERHVESTREQMIQLGEEVHQLRADIRNACDQNTVDAAQVHLRATEICSAVYKVRSADTEFVQKTVNTDLGAGE